MAYRLKLKRAIIFALCLLNGIMIFLNYQAVDKQKLKTYSLDLIQGQIKKLIPNNDNVGDDSETVKQQKQSALMWGKIENLHKALPAYEKMRRTLSNLQDYYGLFNREVAWLGLTREMLHFKSVINQGNIDRLKDIFTDALQTNRSIKIGIVGGTYSSTKLFCKAKSCLYIDLITRWIEKILEVKVLVHNSALTYATSDYYSWCLTPHLDVQDMDIIIWELATEDYIMHDIFPESVFDNPARPQEELTRQILLQPNKPFLLFFNFLSAKNIRTKDCVNSEFFAGHHINRHYNVTSISWATAVCSRLWRYGFSPDDLIRTDSQLSPIAHHQGAIFIINYLRNILEDVTLDQMNKTQSDEKHIQNLISLHDDFMENTNSNNPLLQNRRSKRHINSNSTLNSSRYKQVLPQAMFHGNRLRNPTCWPASKPQFISGKNLQFTVNQGWEEAFSERENWFTSTAPNQQLKFPITITHSHSNFTTTISLAIITCKYCGQALVWLDDHFDGAKLVNSQAEQHMFVVKRVLHGVKAGQHRVCIKNMEEKPFKLAAVMTNEEDHQNKAYDV